MTVKVFLAVRIVGLLALSRVVPACELSAERVGQITGAKATTTADGVVRIGWPRTDVTVAVDGMPLRPFAGLGSWAAFQKTEHGAMLMGDTVVFEDEVNPAIDAAFARGLEITGLHNHFIFDEPKVYFMHLGGAAIDGDFAMTAAEVQPVLKALRRGGINIVALHNHMVGEQPAYYFVHFWGQGEATHLASAFKQALDEQATAASKAPASDAADAERQIRDLEAQFETAVLHGDLEFFERVLAPEFTHTSQNGKHRDRREWLANHKPGESPYEALNVSDLAVRVCGPAAIVTGKIAPTGRSSSGARIEGEYRFLRTWVHQGGTWQVAAFQSTRIAPPEKGTSP